MRFEGAVVKEQGNTFGVVIVKPHVLNDSAARTQMVRFGTQSWGQMPIVLMAQDSQGTPTYWGRRDIVDYLASIDFTRIPWREWTTVGV